MNYSKFQLQFTAKVRKRCGLGAGYHEGEMFKDDAQAGSASECLALCNGDPKCEFWDYGDDGEDGGVNCRLRSEDGGGPLPIYGTIPTGGYYAYGPKHCTFGNASNSLIKFIKFIGCNYQSDQ